MIGRAVVALLVVALQVNPVSGQAPISQDLGVTGRVTDSVSGRPLRDVEVIVEGSGRTYATSAQGEFLIRRESLRDTMLLIRRIGYVPRRMTIAAAESGRPVDLGTVSLRAVATRLDVIAVEAEEVRLNPLLADFYRRKQLGLPGFFVTREDILRSGVLKASEMLRRTAKVVVDCPAPTTWTSPGRDPTTSGECTARNRRDALIRLTPMADNERCEMTMYVDGQRTKRALDDTPLTDVAAIEVYSGPATTPAPFMDSGCGVVAVWTTRGSVR